MSRSDFESIHILQKYESENLYIDSYSGLESGVDVQWHSIAIKFHSF